MATKGPVGDEEWCEFYLRKRAKMIADLEKVHHKMRDNPDGLKQVVTSTEKAIAEAYSKAQGFADAIMRTQHQYPKAWVQMQLKQAGGGNGRGMGH
jgi:hypothetical protein